MTRKEVSVSLKKKRNRCRNIERKRNLLKPFVKGQCGNSRECFACLELQKANLSDRLRWCLMDIQNEMKLFYNQNQQNQCEEQEEQQQAEGIQTIWKLKPSVTNKGLHIHLILDFDHLISIIQI